MTDSRLIVPGIRVTSSGEADVDRALADVLFDLALQLEESTGLPVDVEHVVAALVLAARAGEIDSDESLSSEDRAVVALLTPHVNTIFADFDGRVGTDE